MLANRPLSVSNSVLTAAISISRFVRKAQSLVQDRRDSGKLQLPFRQRALHLAQHIGVGRTLLFARLQPVSEGLVASLECSECRRVIAELTFQALDRIGFIRELREPEFSFGL